MITQLAIFAENTKGTMRDLTGILADAGINLYGMVTNDSAEFGIVRMLTSDSDKAKEVLKDAGYLVHSDRVLAVNISDECGGLNSLLKVLTDANINIDYIYLSWNRKNASPIAIFSCTEAATVEEFLRSRGYETLGKIY